MELERYIIAKYVERIDIITNRISNNFRYKNERKPRFFGLRKGVAEGVYDKFERFGILPSEYSKYNIFVRDKIVYMKPHVVITLASGESIKKYFNTLDECRDLKNEIVSASCSKSVTIS